MELSEWLKLQSRKVRSNVTIIQAPCAYHVSMDAKVKNFTPMIGDRQGDTEDRTIPRVCCSLSIHKAISGHAAVAYDSVRTWNKGKVPIFSIYEFGFNEYLKPNEKLVFDASVTDEIWIVPHSPETTYFKAPVVGEFVLLRIEELYDRGSNNTVFTYVGVTNKPVLIAKDVYINGGFELILKAGGKVNDYVYDNDFTVVSVKQCSASVYSNTVKTIEKNIK